MRTFAVLAAVAFAVALGGVLDGYTREDLETRVWAVLAAGSSGYSNYRHQADVCHAYQVLHAYGVPDEHIVVFMADDIANSPSNPKKGVIINEPNGKDVYAGVPHDYTGSLVTSDNFLKVLRGEEMTVGSRKTLRSTKDDHVLVFFDDHGSRNNLCFPGRCDLNGPKIEEALKAATAKGLFGKLVFYVEACFAGSVFYKQTLPPNVYVATASPVAESSYAYNWDNTVRAYVADIFAWLFIHDTETSPRSKTIDAQYHWITENIQNYSQACQYGDIAMAKKETLASFYNPSNGAYRGLDAFLPPRIKPATDGVPAWDVPYEIARRVYELEPTMENRLAYKRELAFRERVDAMAERIVERASTHPALAIPPCTTCDRTCKCYSYCIGGGSAAFCAFECCNERSCYEDPPKFGLDPAKYTACQDTLASAFLAKCGLEHDYLRAAESRIIRACKDPNVDIAAALEQMDLECLA